MIGDQPGLGVGHRPGHRTVRNRYVALRFNTRVLGYALVAFGALLLLAVWAMTLGSLRIPFGEVVAALLGNGSAEQELIVRDLRLPRVLSAILVGAALAVSGAIFQGLVRNPLVSPDVIGIGNGANIVAVFWIASGLGAAWLPLAAFSGAILAAAAVYALSWKGGINPNRLVLVGIAVGAVLTAGTTYAIVSFPPKQVGQAVAWSLGSVYGGDWGDVWVLAAFVGVGVPLAVGMCPGLRVLQLGDDATRGLGVSVERTRLGLILVGCGLAAVAVAVAGPIGFVALMVPHVARMLGGPLSGSVMVFTGVLGGVFLLGADTIAQHLLPASLPVGVITAAVGAPYFLYLLWRTNVRV